MYAMALAAPSPLGVLRCTRCRGLGLIGPREGLPAPCPDCRDGITLCVACREEDAVGIDEHGDPRCVDCLRPEQTAAPGDGRKPSARDRTLVLLRADTMPPEA